MVNLQIIYSFLSMVKLCKKSSWVARRLQTFKSYVLRKGKLKQSEYPTMLKWSIPFAQTVLNQKLKQFNINASHQALNKAPKNCDKLKMVNRILDGVMLAVLLVKILDYLSVETGFALTSIAAVGTTGGLIVSLASQEIAKGILSGVEMASSDRFYEGDEVHFGDG